MLSAELNKASLDVLIKKFDAIPADPKSEYETYFEEIVFAIADKEKEGIKFLKSKLANANDHQLVSLFMVLPLYGEGDRELNKVLQKSLKDKRPMIVAAAIDGLKELEEDEIAEDIKALINHESPYVKAAVLRYLARLYPDVAYPVLIGCLKHADYIVRQNAADELGELGNAEAVPFLKPLVKDPHEDVRDAAKTAIEMLSD